MINLGKSSQEVNTVYKTNDLTMFKDITGNRPTNPQHISRLTESVRVNGLLCNPILVNEKMEVIDGQHRLEACRNANSEVFFIMLTGYSLPEVQTLNLNQKNWTQKDFMEGYAKKGLAPYVKLRDFYNLNSDFNLADCVAFCSNVTGSAMFNVAQNFRTEKPQKIKQVFQEGTWTGKDFKLGQEYANKIRMIGKFYAGYNRSSFVGTMIGMLQRDNFDFNEFTHKLRLQPTALVDCSSRMQYKILIEDIYNYKSRNKVNLRI